jgi:hypothetical protein
MFENTASSCLGAGGGSDSQSGNPQMGQLTDRMTSLTNNTCCSHASSATPLIMLLIKFYTFY